MTQLPRYSIKIEQSAGGLRAAMVADPEGEFVRFDAIRQTFMKLLGESGSEEQKKQTPPATNDHKSNEALFDLKRIAWAMDVSPLTVKDWLSKGRMPAPDIRSHRFNRWRPETILPFINDPIGWGEQNLPESLRKRRSTIAPIWSVDDIEFLTRNYGKLSNFEIAEHLGRTVGATRTRAIRLGLESPASSLGGLSNPNNSDHGPDEDREDVERFMNERSGRGMS